MARTLEWHLDGLTFAETDEMNMALELAVREVLAWRQILAAQRDRTQNPDRKSEFEFVMPALSADPAVREQAFERFRNIENRRREPWVHESLHYLNHPAHRRHLLSAAMDGCHARRTPLAGGGQGSPGFPGAAPGSSRALTMEGPKLRR